MLRLGELLIGNKKINAQELSLCVNYQRINSKEKLGSLLRHFNFTDDLTIAEVLSKQIGLPLYTDKYEPSYDEIESFGLDFFLENQIYPLKTVLGSAFVLSLIDNVEITDSIRSKVNDKTTFYIGVESEIRNALEILAVQHENHKTNLEYSEIIGGQGESLLNAWLDKVLNLAILQRSTDVHIEPTEIGMEVRFRIDGILVFRCCVKKEYINAVSNILLSKCNANPSEFHKFHDGRFEYKYSNRSIDVRFSQIPSMYGPAIVLRLLDKARASFNIRELGYSEHNQNIINNVVHTPHGIILVTGPTGCGKSTTLYSMLNQIKSLEKKIVTVEDPVEMTHSLMTQVHVNNKQDITFSSAIRAYLRHDPDIMLIGEIRDKETAQESVRAAQTGHQIFSTLHTNDAISAILRLHDLGIDLTNIANSLVAVLSQRLVRKLCNHCKQAVRVDKVKLPLLEAKYIQDQSQVIYFPCGCIQCVNGYRGRTVVAEVLVLTDEIKAYVASNKIENIKELLKKDASHRTIHDDIVSLIKVGSTSVEEAIRVLG